jgi:YD repeat-containing protein
MTYNLLGDVITKKDRRGTVTTVTYDLMGKPTETSTPLSASINVTTSVVYDGADNVIAETDANGNVTNQRIKPSSGFSALSASLLLCGKWLAVSVASPERCNSLLQFSLTASDQATASGKRR